MRKITCFILAIVMIASCFTCFADTEEYDCAAESWTYIEIMDGYLYKTETEEKAYDFDSICIFETTNGVLIMIQNKNEKITRTYKVNSIYFTPVICMYMVAENDPNDCMVSFAPYHKAGYSDAYCYLNNNGWGWTTIPTHYYKTFATWMVANNSAVYHYSIWNKEYNAWKEKLGI